MLKDTNSNNPVVVFKNVSKIFEEPQHEPALRDVSFRVDAGDFICLIGPSGGGKTTILRIIGGLIEQTSGQVTKPDNVSMVFQSGALFPWLSVFENVAIVLQAQNLSQARIDHEAKKFIEMMGLGKFSEKYPRDLSGGQRQRVGIARALAVDPSVLLLDEPFSALDPKTTDELHKDVVKIWQETGKTIIMVSHLIEEAVSLANKVILIKDFTIADIFPINLPRPRREQELEFSQRVNQIRREFFR